MSIKQKVNLRLVNKLKLIQVNENGVAVYMNKVRQGNGYTLFTTLAQNMIMILKTTYRHIGQKKNQAHTITYNGTNIGLKLKGPA